MHGAAESGYMAEIYQWSSTQRFEFFKYVDGNRTNLGGINNTWGTGEWMLRMQAIGNVIKAKTWLASSQEPSTWQFSVVDNDLQSGKVALSSANGNSSTARPIYWDNLRIYDIENTNEPSIKLGALGTNSDGTPSNDSDRAFCPPGDTRGSCGPVGYWKFEEGSGTTIIDSSGNGLNGGMQNNPTYVAGKVGKALNFVRASGQRAYVNDNAVLRPGNGSWTWTLWAKPPAGNITGGLMSKWNMGAGHGYGMFICSGFSCASSGQTLHVVYMQNNTNTYRLFSSTEPVNDGEWHHFAVVADKDADTLYVYRDGKRVAGNITSLGSWPNITDTSQLFIGESHLTGGPFDGAIDEVKIYNYARTPAQIAWDYNQGKPVLHWKFDECSGPFTYDSSGNGFHGYIVTDVMGFSDSGSCSTPGDTMRYNGREGKFNYGLYFDGVDDHTSANSNNHLNPPDQISVAMWFRPDETLVDFQAVLGKGGGTSFELGYEFASVNHEFGFWINGSSNMAKTTKPANGELAHWVGTYDGSAIKLYKNGVLVDSVSYSGTITSTLLPFVVGKVSSNGGNKLFTKGLYDDIRVYNYALTEHQVRSIMNGGAVRWGPNTGAP